MNKTRFGIVDMMLHLCQSSYDAEEGTNPMVALMSHHAWKNVECTIQSALYVVFEAAGQDLYLEASLLVSPVDQ
ncbi:MAG: hypothetical protein P4M11_08980 [Candidatus Pacebacteria bacterium]|nr:hypothetical protein [Candidatus Paceibacterota bacterium]